MEVKELLIKLRTILQPNIKDWTLDYEDKKFRKDWWRMGHIEWFVFHTKAYKWVLFNLCLGSTVLFSFLSWLFYTRENNVFAVIFLLLMLRMGYATIVKLKSWKVLNTSTFYDILFRDYYTK